MLAIVLLDLKIIDQERAVRPKVGTSLLPLSPPGSSGTRGGEAQGERG